MKKIIFLFHIFLLSFLTHQSTNPQSFLNQSNNDDPDINRTGEQIILEKGYGLEVHFVTTQDFYILKVFRILNKLKNLLKSTI